jgi:ABC-type spermidine/putrescine transport system permease subunit II
METAIKSLLTFIFVACYSGVVMGIGMWVMVNGWGIEPKSWPIVIGWAVALTFFMSLIQAIGVVIKELK